MSNNERVRLTEQGLRALQDELDYLRNVERTKVSERIKEAKEGGDVSESGEYEDAKQHQAFVEGRIRDLERLLARAETIDDSTRQNGVVDLGARVTVDEEGRRDTYMIVSRAEAGRGKNGEVRISNESSVGAALLGHRVGERVQVKTPGGIVSLTIVSVE